MAWKAKSSESLNGDVDRATQKSSKAIEVLNYRLIEFSHRHVIRLAGKFDTSE
jgi:hypothetical protein